MTSNKFEEHQITRDAQAILRLNPHPADGKLHFVSLDEIRDRFGKTWPRHRARVMEAAETALRHHLGEHDIFLPHGDAGFVLLFGSKQGDDAAVTCGLVKADLLRRFVGDSAIAGLKVRTEILKLADGTLDSANLEALLRAAPQASDSPYGTPLTDEPVSRHGVDAREAIPAGTEHRARMERAMATVGLDPFGSWSRLGPDAGAIRLRFDPICFAVKRVVTSFALTPTRFLRDDPQPIVGYAALGELSRSAIGLLDRIVLGHAIRTVIDGSQHARRSLIIVPVSSDTLSSADLRDAYLEHLDRLSPDAQRLLVPFVRRVPGGVPDSALVDAIAALRTRCRAVGARVRIDLQMARGFKAAGVFSGSLVLGAHGDPNVIEPARIEASAALLRKAGLAPVLTGIACNGHLKRALAAGYDYVGGPAVAQQVDAPFPPRAWQPPDERST